MLQFYEFYQSYGNKTNLLQGSEIYIQKYVIVIEIIEI